MIAYKGSRASNQQAKHHRKSQDFHRSPPMAIVRRILSGGVGGSEIGFGLQDGMGIARCLAPARSLLRSTF
jgi:hypothetical protein